MALTMPMKTWEKGGSGNASTTSSVKSTFNFSKDSPFYEASTLIDEKNTARETEESKRKKYEEDKTKAKYYADNIGSFVKTYNDISDYSSGFFDSWKSQHDSKHTQSLYTSLQDNFTKLRDSVLDNSYLRDVLSEDDYNNAVKEINAIGRSIEDAMAGIKSASDVYAQYGNADDYDKHVRSAMNESLEDAKEKAKAEEEAKNALPEFDRLAFENSLLATQKKQENTPVRNPSEPVSPLMQNIESGSDTTIEFPNALDNRDDLMKAQAEFGKYIDAKKEEGKTIPSIKEEDLPKATLGENALGFAQTASTNLALGAANTISSIVTGLEQAIGDAASGGAYSEGFKVLSDYFGAMPSEFRTEVLAELGMEGNPNRPSRIANVSRATGVSQNVIEQYAKSVQNENMRESVLDFGYAQNMNPTLKKHTADISFSIGQQIPGLMLSGALSGATSASSAVSSAIGANPSTVLIGMSVAGNEAFNLAREKGYNPSIYAEAVMQGGIEMILEGLLGFSDVASYQKLMSNTGSTIGNVAKSFIKYIVSGAEEGLEEVINIPLSNLTSMMFGADKKIGFGEGDVFDYKEMIKSGMNGSAVGLIMGGVMGTSMAVSAVKEGADIRYNADWLNKMAQKLPEHYRPAIINATKATETDIENYGKELTNAFNKYMTDSMNGEAVLSNKDKYGDDVTSVTEDNSTVQLADQAEVLAHVQAEDTEGAKEIIEQKIQHYNEAIEALSEDESLKEMGGEDTAEKIASNVARLTETKDMLNAGTYNADEAQKAISAQMQKKIAEGKKTTAAARQFAETVKSNLGVVQGERSIAHTVELLEADVKNGVNGASAQLKVAKKALDSIRKEPSAAVRSLLGNSEKELGAAISDSNKKRSVQFDYSMPEGSYASYNRGTGTVKINPTAVLMAQSQMDNGNKARSEFVHEAGHIAAQMDASFVSNVYDIYAKLRDDGTIPKNGLDGLNEDEIREAYRNDKSLSNYLNTATVKNGIKQLVAQGATVEQARESFVDAFLKEEMAMHFLSWSENNGANLYNTIVPEKRNAFVEAMRKIAQFFRDIAAKIRGKDPASAKKMESLADKLYNAVADFAGGSTTAQESVKSKTNENTTATESVESEGSTGTREENERKSLVIGDETAVAEDGDTRYSIKSMRHDIAEGKMFDDLVRVGVFSREDADTLRDNLDRLVKYMIPFAGTVDMNEEYGQGDRPFRAYKPNSDPLYVISLDFSTLCRKRLMTQYVIEQLQLRENRPMTAEEQIAIRSMLLDYRKQNKALQVACAMCYVEAARLKAPKQMEKFFTDTESILKTYFAKKDSEFNAKVRRAQEEFKVSRGYEADTPKSGMKGKDVTALNRMSSEMRRGYEPSEEQAAIIETAKSLPRSTFLTAANLTELSVNHPEIYDAYTSHIRASTRSKSLEGDIPYYYGDSEGIVSDSFIENVNEENGFRFDSWSDFQMKHMLDMITAVIELSVRGSKMHGYTKFPEMVRIFGKTGMMFNLSGVAAGNGFDADGNLAFSDVEGMAYEDAVKLRNDFPDTAGFQCIGVSHDHIRALLRSDDIDYVIPYHTSGLNATLRRMVDIYGWKDYTGVQSAKKDPNAKKPANAENWQVEPVWSEFYVSDGKDGYDSTQKTAQRYIDMCHERGLIPKFNDFTDEPNYWKLLIDRKMVNQKTGALIEQKPVRPDFDFGLIEDEVKREVSEYDPKLEQDALNYVVDNFDAIGSRIRELKKIAPKKKLQTVGNEVLQAYAEGSKVVEDERKSLEVKPSVITEAMDADYMSAIERGDMAEVQRMVDEAARAAGYPVKAYHGTPTGGFTSFDYSKIGSNTGVGRGRFSFTSDKATADVYSDKKNVTPRASTLVSNLNSLFHEYDSDYIRELFRGDTDEGMVTWDADVVIGDGALDSGYITFDYDWEDNDPELYSSPSEARYAEGLAKYNGTRAYLVDTLKDYQRNAPESTKPFFKAAFEMLENASADRTPMTYSVYIPSPGKVYKANTETYNKVAWDAAYDSANVTAVELDNGETRYFVRNAEDIKSADPITYDDNGNVIPLSQRFNEENDDIRYSKETSESRIARLKEDKEFLNKYIAREISSKKFTAKEKDAWGKELIQAYNLDATTAHEKLGAMLNLIEQSASAAEEKRSDLFAQIRRLSRDLIEESGGVDAALVVQENDEEGIRLIEEQAENLEISAMLNYFAPGNESKVVSAYAARLGSIRNNVERRLEWYSNLLSRQADKITDLEDEAGIAKYRDTVRKRTKVMLSMANNPNRKRFVAEKHRNSVRKIAKFLDDVADSTLQASNVSAEEVFSEESINNVKAHIASLEEILGEDGVGLANLLVDQMVITNESGKENEISQKLALGRLMKTEKNLAWMLYKSIRESNKVYLSGKNENATDVGSRIKDTLEKRKGKQKEFESLADKKRSGKGMKVLNEVYNKNLSFTDGYSFFHRMGKVGDSIFETLQGAQSRQVLYVKSYTDTISEKLKGVDLSKYAGAKQKTVSVTLESGKEFSMTAAQAMSAVTLFERENGRSHMEKGGIQIYDPKTRQLSKATALTEADISALRNALDEEDKRVMKVFADFMRDECTVWGNEATMEKYGFHRFTTANYFPIKVNRDATGADMKTFAPSQFNVENVGFAKSAKEDASAPVIIGSMIDVANAHVSGMATYAAYLNVEDGINRVLKVDGVKDAMRRALGSDAEKYITEMMNDLKGAGKDTKLSDNAVEVLNKMAGRYKAAAVSYNASTVAKQPLSYLRAAAVIGEKYLGKGVIGDKKQAFEQMMQYSGIAVRKEIGYSDVGVGKTVGDRIGYTEKGTFAYAEGKFNEFGMMGAAAADRLTWEALWIACRAEQAEKNAYAALDNDALMQATAKRFAEVVARTQVVDSALTSAPVSRSNNPLVRLSYAFTSEPIKNYNMLVTAIDDLVNADDKAAKSKAAKHIAHVSVYTAIGWAIEAAITSAFQALRDDDDDFFGKFGETYLPNLLENTAGLLVMFDPIAETLKTKFQGYDVTSMADQPLADLVDNLIDLWDVVIKNKDGKRETEAKIIRDTFESISTLAGMPMKNLFRILTNARKALFHSLDLYKAEYNFQKFWYNPDNATAREKNEFNSLLADAYISGDKEAYEYIYEDMRKSGLKPQSLVSSIAKDAYAGDIADSEKSTLVKYTPGSDAWYIGMKTIFDRDENAPKATEDEITRVYKATSETSVLPKFKDGKYTVDGVSKEFEGASLDKYLEDYGRLYYEVANAMRDLSAYRRGSAEEQAWWLTKAERFASAVAVYTQDKDYSVTSVGKWVTDYIGKKPYEVAKYIVGNLEKK